jgi:hypothetical protein
VAVNDVGCEMLLGSCVGFPMAQPVYSKVGTVLDYGASPRILS